MFQGVVGPLAPTEDLALELAATTRARRKQQNSWTQRSGACPTHSQSLLGCAVVDRAQILSK